MEVVAQTLQFALRSLTKRPSFALTVVLTLALGIGANTAIFSILHALVLRNLPVAEPDRLVVVSRNQLSLPYPLFRHFQDHATTLDGVLAFRTAPWRFSSGGSTERITGVLVSNSYFGVLGVGAAIGTTIRHEDDVTPGSGGDRGPVAVLSYGFWQSRFAGRPGAIGESIVLNGRPFTIVGVAPPGFSGTEVGPSPDVFAPMTMQSVLLPAVGDALAQPRNNWLRIIGRVTKDVDVRQAELELTSLLKPYNEDILKDPVVDRFGPNWRRNLLSQQISLLPAGTGVSALRTRYSTPLLVLMIVMGLVLLVACANIANLNILPSARIVYCRDRYETKGASMRWNLLVDELAADLRHAIRQIARAPGFTAAAVLTLALGIGANTALFSIFNSLILRPLPVRDPGRLALLIDGSWSYPIWNEIRTREAELFDGTLAWSAQRFDLSAGGQTEPADGAYVSGGFFDVLGVNAFRGRMLTPADDGAPSASRGEDGPVAVISHRLWRQRFARSDDVVGRQLTVQRLPFTIVGVMPPGFFGADVGRTADVILPFAAEPLIRGPESRLTAKSSWWLQIMVRLKPGQSLGQANAALRVIQTQITEGASRQIPPFTLVAAATGNSSLRNRFERPLLAMVVGVGLVLLVACANIASLMLARTLARRREFSVRLALGSSRWRIARLLFIESLIVAVAGAAVGLVFASWSSAVLVQQLTTWQSTVSLDLGLDWRVLAFTAVLACLSAVVAGVAPVLGLRRVGAGEALKDSGRGIASGGRLSVRGTIVVVQIAVSFALVVGAGLFLHTFASLNRLPLGFVPGPLLVAELNLQTGGGRPEARNERVERLRDATAAVPGVRSAAVSSVRLLTGGGTSSGMIAINDGPMLRIRPPLWLNGTTPGWFGTMGIPLRSGRDFETGDRLGSRPVAIVNETFVRRFMDGEQPIGQSLRLGFDPGTRYEIVGVVGDSVYTTPRDGMLATMYVAMAQRKPAEFWPTVLLTLNMTGTRTTVERDVAEALRRADPAVAFTFGTFDQLVEATATQERLMALVSAFFGGLALLLAALGLYGVVAHAVRARQKEIGLRIALGATPSSILRIVFERVGLLIAAGLAVGVAGTLWASRFVETLLFQLAPRDPATFGGAAAVLVAVGVVAAWLPAHRAARIDPVAALRTE